MIKEVRNIDDLFACVKADKEATGDDVFVANRYPIRFVLFDNFQDSFDFVMRLGCNVESIEPWLDAEYPDRLITHSELSDRLADFVQQADATKDVVIAPFSELARFYDNKQTLQFDSLIRTIKSIETCHEGFRNRQRIYIPIIGLEGKMGLFAADTQITIWYYKNIDNRINYRLILANSTYNINGLDERYTLVSNVKEWLNVWQKQDVKSTIISTSLALIANAEYAQPDNAFDFCICNNVFDFLTKGLNLNFGEIEYRKQDEQFWLRLAKEIEIEQFSFDSFFNSHFHIDKLADYKVFLKTWFECTDDFEKWLLCTYYLNKFCNSKSYICQAINHSESFSNRDFFSSILITIFDCENAEQYIDERRICLQYAEKSNIILTVDIEHQLENQLKKVESQQSTTKAIRYLSSLTNTEKKLIIEWIGEGKISYETIKEIYPDLYNYAVPKIQSNDDFTEYEYYFDEYRNCKISNKISIVLKEQINSINKNSVSFNNWYQNFKTTKTFLSSRSDIEVFYWIDGLGIEWIPYITQLINNEQGIYLNETHIARALIPTTTAINKPQISDLSHNTLQKIGDLDSHAHSKTNKFPNYIIEEFGIVKKAIRKIFSEYSGKKIAIISDHGLTAMSQLCDGLNMGGLQPNHGGRLATKEIGAPILDDNYYVCDDNKTLCALKHNSLCAKVPFGQSSHGGCTPEEILVPIFILSAQKEISNYSVRLITTEITGNNPIIEFEIKGVSDANDLFVIYNNNRYNLTCYRGNIYRSEELSIVPTINNITLYIGSNFRKTFSLKINIGAEEDDLFNF